MKRIIKITLLIFSITLLSFNSAFADNNLTVKDLPILKGEKSNLPYVIWEENEEVAKNINSSIYNEIDYMNIEYSYFSDQGIFPIGYSYRKNDNILSIIKVTKECYEGDNYCDEYNEYYNFDLKNGKYITIKDIFTKYGINEINKKIKDINIKKIEKFIEDGNNFKQIYKECLYSRTEYKNYFSIYNPNFTFKNNKIIFEFEGCLDNLGVLVVDNLGYFYNEIYLNENSNYLTIYGLELFNTFDKKTVSLLKKINKKLEEYFFDISIDKKYKIIKKLEKSTLKYLKKSCGEKNKYNEKCKVLNYLYFKFKGDYLNYDEEVEKNKKILEEIETEKIKKLGDIEKFEYIKKNCSSSEIKKQECLDKYVDKNKYIVNFLTSVATKKVNIEICDFNYLNTKKTSPSCYSNYFLYDKELKKLVEDNLIELSPEGVKYESLGKLKIILDYVNSICIKTKESLKCKQSYYNWRGHEMNKYLENYDLLLKNIEKEELSKIKLDEANKYWKKGEKEKAKKNYEEYVYLMVDLGRYNKVPKYVMTNTVCEQKGKTWFGLKIETDYPQDLIGKEYELVFSDGKVVKAKIPENLYIWHKCLPNIGNVKFRLTNNEINSFLEKK